MEQFLGILDIIFQISQTGKYHISVSIQMSKATFILYQRIS